MYIRIYADLDTCLKAAWQSGLAQVEQAAAGRGQLVTGYYLTAPLSAKRAGLKRANYVLFSELL